MAEMDLAAGTQDQVLTAGNAGSQDAQLEKMLPQSKVNEIVGHNKQEAYERGKRDAMMELQQQQSIQQQGNAGMQNQAAASNSGNIGGMPQLSPDAIRQMITEEAQKQSQQSVADRFVKEFTQKLEAGKSKYPDFEATIAQLNLPQIPHIVHWANGVDNTADVMYDIASNPAKFANLLTLAQVSPQLAQKELLTLSESIKTNANAGNSPSVNEPLSQVKGSPIGTDNGSLTVRDFRKKSYLRG